MICCIYSWYTTKCPVIFERPPLLGPLCPIRIKLFSHLGSVLTSCISWWCSLLDWNSAYEKINSSNDCHMHCFNPTLISLLSKGYLGILQSLGQELIHQLKSGKRVPRWMDPKNTPHFVNHFSIKEMGKGS